MRIETDMPSKSRISLLLKAAALGAATALALSASSAPASAGLLDALFGPRIAPAPVYAPQPAAPIRLLPSRPTIPPFLQKAQEKGQARALTIRAKAPKTAHGESTTGKKIAGHPPMLAGPLGPFLLDPTLRRGDFVVTAEGVKAFTGPAGSQHSNSDFTAVSRAGQFNSALSAIDDANRRAAQPLVQVQAEPTPAPQEKADVAPTLPGKQAALTETASR